MEELKEKHGVSVVWRSYELHPEGGPPVSPEYIEQVNASRPHFIQMAKEQYGVAVNPGKYGINSRPALIGAKFAEEHNAGDEYHQSVFKTYWQDARSIENIDELLKIAEGIGLSPTAFQEALTDPVYDKLVNQDIAQARAYKLHMVPSMVFNNGFLLKGAQPYSVLVRALDMIKQES